jgi:hypothetical protein
VLCFGFINPQVIRLMLDRSKFIVHIVPSAEQNMKQSLTFYENSLAKPTKQHQVFIIPDFKTLSALLKSGRFSQESRYVLCAPPSKLEEHDLDIFDATFKGEAWQAKSCMGATATEALLRSAGIDEETVAKAIKKVERVEHQFSNPKNVEERRTDIKRAFALLGDRRTEAGETALLKLLIYGFVGKQLAKSTQDIDSMITLAKRRACSSANAKAFAEYVKAKRIPMTKEAAQYVRDMQSTSVPRVAIVLAWKVFISGRPASLAAAETGCDLELAMAIARRLALPDVPTPLDVKRHREPSVVHNAHCTVITLKRGYYDMVKLVRAAGYDGESDTDVLAKSSHPVKFNRGPRWHDNRNWWPVGIDEKPLMMLFNGRKFRFEPKP